MHATASFTGLTLTSCCLIIAVVAGGCRVCSPQPNLKTGYQVGRRTCETVIPGGQDEVPCSTPRQVETTAHVERSTSGSYASDLFYGIEPTRRQGQHAESFVHEFPTSFAANRPSAAPSLSRKEMRPYQRVMPASRLHPSTQPIADARDATWLPSHPRQDAVATSTLNRHLSNLHQMIPSMPSWGQAPVRDPQSPRRTSYSAAPFPYSPRQDLARRPPSYEVEQPSPSRANLPNRRREARAADQDFSARNGIRHQDAPGPSGSYWDRVESKR